MLRQSTYIHLGTKKNFFTSFYLRDRQQTYPNEQPELVSSPFRAQLSSSELRAPEKNTIQNTYMKIMNE